MPFSCDKVPCLANGIPFSWLFRSICALRIPRYACNVLKGNHGKCCRASTRATIVQVFYGRHLNHVYRNCGKVIIRVAVSGIFAFFHEQCFFTWIYCLTAYSAYCFIYRLGMFIPLMYDLVQHRSVSNSRWSGFICKARPNSHNYGHTIIKTFYFNLRGL